MWNCFAYITCIRLYGYGYTFKGFNMQCSIYGHIYFVSFIQIADNVLSISSPLKCSLAFYKCVQRELFPTSTPRFSVQTHYCGPTNAWVVRCLSWKTISIPWFGRDYWHGGRADNSNKTANKAKYSNCKGGCESRELLRQPTKLVIAAILNFVSTSNFIFIHSPSIYKLSMIRSVHKVHFDVDFREHIDFTLFSRDNLKKRHNNEFVVRPVC